MKKISVLLVMSVILVCQCFGQQYKIDYEKNRSGKDIYYVSKIKIEIEDADTLFFIDQAIPGIKRIEAYEEGIAFYDTSRVSSNYNANHFWLTRYYNMEYKIAKFDKAKKEIRQTVATTVSSDSSVSVEIIVILFLAIILVLSIFLTETGDCSDKDIEKPEFGLVFLLPWLGYSICLLVSFFGSFHNPESQIFVGVLMSVAGIFFVVSMFTTKWNKNKYIVFQTVNLSIALMSIGAITGSWWASFVSILASLFCYSVFVIVRRAAIAITEKIK
ncbi:TPA: hypothetical protein DCZ15_04330 [Candidatus Falkowbacteria bacterium]|nr:MAG: hypothetical protein UV95_C0001G0310 [Candidatus Falkowbacteria bacterium GW2011_GWF2_43_32]HBA37061.1 hypothetical protein [Candidatus Falkowbacteria bacterium]